MWYILLTVTLKVPPTRHNVNPIPVLTMRLTLQPYLNPYPTNPNPTDPNHNRDVKILTSAVTPTHRPTDGNYRGLGGAEIRSKASENENLLLPL